jgi:hypothetical protein
MWFFIPWRGMAAARPILNAGVRVLVVDEDGSAGPRRPRTGRRRRGCRPRCAREDAGRVGRGRGVITGAGRPGDGPADRAARLYRPVARPAPVSLRKQGWSTPEQRRIFSRIALAFGVAHAVVTSADYFVQFAVVVPSPRRGETAGLSLVSRTTRTGYSSPARRGARDP